MLYLYFKANNLTILPKPVDYVIFIFYVIYRNIYKYMYTHLVEFFSSIKPNGEWFYYRTRYVKNMLYNFYLK